VSDFRFDAHEATVGRFRKFVAAYSQDMTPAGAGKDPHDPGDSGWDPSWNPSLPPTASDLKVAVQCSTTFSFQTWTDSPGPNENKPINCIDWYEAFAFCIWDGGRLPTEAEWNYAAAGGSEQRVYPWGSMAPATDANLAVHGCYYGGGDPNNCSAANIAPVGSVVAGNGKWGQTDLAGGVWEWTLDWYASPYPEVACTDCANLTASPNRATRGGGFDSDPYVLLASFRSYARPDNRDRYTGVRCARDP
jgi:formylglycine-generating enzyme required for sulfatase activity